MRRQLITFITSIAFIVCITPVSYAQDYRFYNNDPFANKNAAHAGVYLKIPFTGGLKKYKKNKLKFGATLGFRRNYTQDYNANFNRFKPQKIMGWTTSGSLSDDEHDALEGIGFLRGIRDFEDRVSRVKAIEKLKSNDLFHDRVRSFFPFIDLDKAVGPDPDKGW